MERIKRLLLIVIFIISIFIIAPDNIYAATSSSEYVINKYDINIVVNENNTFDITENITTYFNVSKHGIYRTIPLRNNITRLDGSTSKNRAQVTNINVNNEYTMSRDNNNLKIKIGSADRLVTGEQNYMIKYTYNIGKDPLKDIDELYFNIIGTEWDTTISNLTFTIVMPKEFDASKLGFAVGLLGAKSSEYVNYHVEGNIIIGSVERMLNPGEALTVRCELPEGYFVNAGFDINIINYIEFLVPFIFMVISLLLWYMYGRDDPVVETIEFYPPQGFNSLEVGFLFKGDADSIDVVSLLIYLANKGYIKITEEEKSSKFRITKLKDYDGNNINEQIFLNGLFMKKPKVISLFGKNNVEEDNKEVTEVISSDLYNRFYMTTNSIISNMNKKENRYKIFEKIASSKSKYIVLMIIATYLLITLVPMFTYGFPDNSILGIVFSGIGLTIFFVFLFGKSRIISSNNKTYNSPLGTKILGSIMGLLFGGIPFGLILLPTLLQDNLYLIGYIFGVLCIGGMILALTYLPRRTAYGNEMLGKIGGFRNYLETAEKDQLEDMVLKEPTYFYNILPYAYVLGVSDKWIKKFETIALKAPDWYDSHNSFDMVSFGSFMNSTMKSALSVMSSSSSSDSGSSGGGSSGGGSGGGGGGSW